MSILLSVDFPLVFSRVFFLLSDSSRTSHLDSMSLFRMLSSSPNLCLRFATFSWIMFAIETSFPTGRKFDDFLSIFTVLLKEGLIAPYAYIIEEGECKLVGSQNPLKRPGSAPPRGLISKTTSCFNIGMLSPGEWVGEDSILSNKTLGFSVIAASYVSALRISRDNFLVNLTKHEGY